MKHSVKMAIVFVAAVAALTCVAAGAGAQEYLSPGDLVADSQGKALYVAEATANQVAVFEVAAGKVARAIALGDSPSGVAISPDGSRLYVTVGSASGAVCVVNAASGQVESRIALGHTPMAPVVTADGKTLYVCNRFNNDISIVDLGAGKETARVPVLREPVAAALTPDGKALLIANHLPAGASDSNYVSSAVSILDTASGAIAATVQLPNGCTGLRGICVSPDGKYAYVTHILGRYQLPTTQLERGWMNTNALSVIDVAGRNLVNSVLLDDVDLGAANPWDVACTPDGKYLCTTHAGTHEIHVIDRAAMHDKLDAIARGESVSTVSLTSDDVPNDLSFLVGMRRRIQLGGNGPHGLAIIGTMAYAAEYFTDSLGVVDVNPESAKAATSIALGQQTALSTPRKGEQFFNDAAFCFQGWQSCASCHPDVRSDALNWDLLNDGMGNPKNSKSLLLSHSTPPVMGLGVRANAETAVRAGIKHIQFAVRPEEDAQAIDEYLKSLTPVASPYLVNGQLSEAAQRGRELFTKAGCADCHSGQYYTDLNQYKVGTGKDMDKDRDFDTPTLIEVWRTAPYLHDGRAVTIMDVLTTHNQGDAHGQTSNLTKEQLEDLAAYVLSL